MLQIGIVNCQSSCVFYLQVIEDMQAAGIEPDIVTHELLVRAHIALLDVPRMMASLRSMLQAGFEPRVHLLEACIARGEREGRLDAVEWIEALPALRRLRTIGNIPKVGLYASRFCGVTTVDMCHLKYPFLVVAS